MAQQPESGRNASGIARAGKRKWGYNPEQVDEFLERTHALYDSEDAQLTQQDIQNVSFDLSKGGYVISRGRRVGPARTRRGGSADHPGDRTPRACGVEGPDRGPVPQRPLTPTARRVSVSARVTPRLRPTIASRSTVWWIRSSTRPPRNWAWTG